MEALLNALELCLKSTQSRFEDAFLRGTSQLFWLYLLSSLGLALAVFLWHERQKEHPRFARALRYLFPRSIWLSRSALIDYGFILINGVILVVCVFPFAMSGDVLGRNVARLWRELLGEHTQVFMPPLAANLCYTILLVLVGDFASYAVHRLCHTVPFLWQFHKAHHSTTTMTPLSAFRQHPVETYLIVTALGLAFGLVTGTFRYFHPMTFARYTILGGNALLFIFHIFSANLHHSHVWLTWGSAIERFFISPAQHQIHHSTNPKHYDKNFGVVFAIWDWMFGTLYLIRKREYLTFGLGEREDREFRSLWRVYWYPFASAFRVAFPEIRRRRSAPRAVRPEPALSAKIAAEEKNHGGEQADRSCRVSA